MLLFSFSSGSGVAKYSGEHLHKKVMDSQLFMSGRFRDSLKAGFLAIDDSLRKGKQAPADPWLKYHRMKIFITDGAIPFPPFLSSI